ncbi:hypothetical protein GGR57DRAFT_114381 [Xylariaceae sp. FL1272]|nr:hypothetical protein GGR57DRAFT_114381 [Xylariaceae sp. FL1272]
MDYLTSLNFPAHVAELMKKHHVPGLAIAVVHGDRTFSAGYGLSSIDPPKPCMPETVFDIAPSSKSLTAASVALLVHDHEKYPEAQWDAAMSSLLPDEFMITTIDIPIVLLLKICSVMGLVCPTKLFLCFLCLGYCTRAICLALIASRQQNLSPSSLLIVSKA